MFWQIEQACPFQEDYDATLYRRAIFIMQILRSTLDYVNEAIGNTLKGFSWMVLGCVFSIPLALLLALFGKILGFGKGDGEAT